MILGAPGARAAVQAAAQNLEKTTTIRTLAVNSYNIYRQCTQKTTTIRGFLRKINDFRSPWRQAADQAIFSIGKSMILRAPGARARPRLYFPKENQ